MVIIKVKVRLCRLILIIATLTTSFYLLFLQFGDVEVPYVSLLSELNLCPVCYGVTVCPELYSKQVIIDSKRKPERYVYEGITLNNKPVLLKKLAHIKEFNNLGRVICSEWGLSKHCKPMDLLTVSNKEERIMKEITYNHTPDLVKKLGLLFCPSADGFRDFIRPVIMMGNETDDKSISYQSSLINIWTMVRLNAEPIILQVISKSKGWPVPDFGGVCGRLELVAYEGLPLEDLLHVEWIRKLEIAKNILKAAMDFTFKHERYRFYILDWSLSNIVVNERNEVSFIDLEDIMILDKQISPGFDSLPNWYRRYSETIVGTMYSFSVVNICNYHLSDHNIWSACHLLGRLSFLYPMERFDSNLNALLKSCLEGRDDRFETVLYLHQYLHDLLEGITGNQVFPKQRR